MLIYPPKIGLCIDPTKSGKLVHKRCNDLKSINRHPKDVKSTKKSISTQKSSAKIFRHISRFFFRSNILKTSMSNAKLDYSQDM